MINIKKLTAQEMMDRGIIEYTYFNPVAAVIIILLLATIMFSANQIVRANKHINCRAFSTQTDAQKTYDLDPIKYKSLDRNHNGIPCQALLNK